MKIAPLLLLLTNFIMTASDQTITPLRTMALEAATQVLHAKLQKPQSYENRIALINQWEEKSGLVTLKDDCKQETILDRFEQRYFTQLQKYKTFLYPIRAMTSDGTQVIANHESTLFIKNIISDRAATLEGHTKWINYFSISADNTKGISASHDQTLRLWDLNARQPVAILKGHTTMVDCIAFTSDNNKAISASYDQTLILWNLSTGQPLATLKGHTDRVTHVALTSDNSKAISASEDTTLRLWDLNTGQLLTMLEGHSDCVNHVTVTTDNKQALSASGDKTLRQWDLCAGQSHAIFKGHTEEVNEVAITTDNTQAISASDDKTLRQWDLNTRQPIAILKGHMDFVTHVALTSDNSKAISASYDQTLRLWDLSTGKLLQKADSVCSSNYKILIHKNVVAAENKLFKFEDWQSIIKRMPTE